MPFLSYNLSHFFDSLLCLIQIFHSLIEQLSKELASLLYLAGLLVACLTSNLFFLTSCSGLTSLARKEIKFWNICYPIVPYDLSVNPIGLEQSWPQNPLINGSTRSAVCHELILLAG